MVLDKEAIRILAAFFKKATREQQEKLLKVASEIVKEEPERMMTPETILKKRMEEWEALESIKKDE